MNSYWRVEVIKDGEQLVAIESNMLSGKSDLTYEDIEIIRTCGKSLLGFSGTVSGVCFLCGKEECEDDCICCGKLIDDTQE